MNELATTLKINHNNEIRKLKDIDSYENLAGSIKNKLDIDLEKYELTYYDEDGDLITISNEEDFAECLHIFLPKVPKIFLKPRPIDEEEKDLIEEFPEISLTVSTCERPLEMQSMKNTAEFQKESSSNSGK